MAQHDYGNPQPPFSGTQLNTTLRNWRDALHTLHRGANRPSYVQGGMLWVREVSSTNWELTFYDGADDILVATINPSTNTITPAGAATPADLQTRVAKAGDTMTGLLTLSGAPTSSNHAATKAYVDSAASARVAKAGDTMTGFLTLHANPTANLHAATKAYVDTVAGGGGRKLTGIYVFNSTQNWTRPTGTTAMLVWAVGGGGGGGQGWDSGGGGGGEGGEQP
jgi:hypothetical protein